MGAWCGGMWEARDMRSDCMARDCLDCRRSEIKNILSLEGMRGQKMHTNFMVKQPMV